ncbi:sigma-70 family RNA polymerase sigma factor [Lentzea sp. DG1S-22]|uniref:RNA polymerase sigma factor n=1 Tax=unclassified Lentzea TaxID=2643253 RepID=UPI0027E07B32|nr:MULTISPECIES: sigma-70 family RNA polymerase sigma factor [unclassified Lentzea]MCG8924801.1 sigma-70 family RNA polymerase sigma factor [Lentzea sp. CC55]WVH78933.1 sigma-70 family RNA polymerase sigma factor [Lentzea sp. DG1S-22]
MKREGAIVEDFSAVYRECYPRVLAYAASHAGSRLAEDITSETFTIAWRRLDRMPSNALPWLIGIARNLVREARRQTTHYELADLPADDAFAVIELRAALASLSESDQEVLTLIAWHGLGAAEAAQVLGCTTATFFVRLHRARRRLQAALSSANFDRARESWKTS